MKTQTLTSLARRAVIVTVVALGAAFAVRAATYEIYWAGGSGTEDNSLDVYDKANWANNSGASISSNPGSSHNFHFTNGIEALTYLTGAVTAACNKWTMHAGNYVINGDFKANSTVTFGDTNGKTVDVTVNGGSFYSGDALYIGKSGAGKLTINGGTVEVASGKSTLPANGASSTGTINLNGGVLKTTRIAQNSGTGHLNFNGGTLMANGQHDANLQFIKSGMNVSVGALGGTIDCGGNNVLIDTHIGQTGETGGLNFTGGGSVTIGQASNRMQIRCTGVTSIAPGTTLVIHNLGGAMNVITSGIVVTGVPDVGQKVFVCARGDGYNLDGVSLANVVCPIAPETVFEIDDTKTNIVVKSVGATAPAFWTGAAGDNNLSTPGNWSDGIVPAGNATISCDASATLTVGDGFHPTAITFAKGSAPVTITGVDLTGVVAVTNLSDRSHTINAKVYFAGDIQVSQPAMADTGDLEKAHITFAGGAYAAEGRALENGSSAAVYSRCVFGEYHLRNTAPWSAMYAGVDRRMCVADGATLHVPKANSLTALYVGTGAHVFVGELAATYGQRASFQNYGEMTVSNLITTGSASGVVDFHMTYAQGTANPAVFRFNSITNSMTSTSGGVRFNFADGEDLKAAKHVFYIGEGGVFFKDTSSSIFVLGKDVDGNTETFRPWNSDFSFGERSNNSAALRIYRTVEFNTDDEGGTGRTITLEGVTQTQGTNPEIYVKGSGTLKVDKAANNGVQPAVYVTDASTLSLAAGATLGTGSCAVGETATLELGASNIYSLGDLMLNDDATLKFSFTEKRTAPVLDLTDKTVTFGDQKRIKVSLSGTRPAYCDGGKYFLTAGGKFKWTGESGEAVKATVIKSDDCPKWVKEVVVDEDTGDLYATVVPTGFCIIVM